MVLFYENSPKELLECGVEELSRRLYKVTGMSVSAFTQGGRKYDYGIITFRHHLEARKASELTIKKCEWKSDGDYRPVIEMSHKQFKAFIEGVNFIITASGHLVFKS
jgi:CRISPR-associated endonuclease Csn1